MLDSSEVGYIVGQIVYFIFHFTATVVLWKYGTRRLRKKGLIDYDKTNEIPSSNRI